MSETNLDTPLNQPVRPGEWKAAPLRRDPTLNTLPAPSQAQLAQPTLRFDWMDWLPYVEDKEIPEDQKRALIEALWSIVVAFVDLGWQLAPAAEIGSGSLDLKAILTAEDPAKGKEDE